MGVRLTWPNKRLGCTPPLPGLNGLAARELGRQFLRGPQIQLADTEQRKTLHPVKGVGPRGARPSPGAASQGRYAKSFRHYSFSRNIPLFTAGRLA